MIYITAKKIMVEKGLYKGYFETHFFKGSQHYATIPASARQPRKDSKTITLNCFKWAIDWSL